MPLDEGNKLITLLEESHDAIRLGWDGIGLIIGATGSGKSRFVALNLICHHYNKILKKLIPEWCITADIIKYQEAIDNTSKYDMLLCDEAHTQFSKNNKNDPAQRALINIYRGNREEGRLHLLAFPDFFDINPEISKSDLIRWVIYVYRRRPNVCSKCKYEFIESACPSCGSTKFKPTYTHYKVFDQSGIAQIWKRHNSLRVDQFSVCQENVKPLFKGTVKAYPRDGELAPIYDIKKKENMLLLRKEAARECKKVELRRNNPRLCPECHSTDTRKNKKGLHRCRSCGAEWSKEMAGGS